MITISFEADLYSVGALREFASKALEARDSYNGKSAAQWSTWHSLSVAAERAAARLTSAHLSEEAHMALVNFRAKCKFAHGGDSLQEYLTFREVPEVYRELSLFELVKLTRNSSGQTEVTINSDAVSWYREIHPAIPR